MTRHLFVVDKTGEELDIYETVNKLRKDVSRLQDVVHANSELIDELTRLIFELKGKTPE